MTDAEAEQFLNELEEFFGDSLANHEREPRRWSSQVKLYKYIMGQKPATNPKGEPNGK